MIFQITFQSNYRRRGAYLVNVYFAMPTHITLLLLWYIKKEISVYFRYKQSLIFQIPLGGFSLFLLLP